MPLDVVPIFKTSSQKRGNFIKIISKLKKTDPRRKSKPFSILAFLIKDDLEKKICVKKKVPKINQHKSGRKRLFTERANHPTPHQMAMTRATVVSQEGTREGVMT